MYTCMYMPFHGQQLGAESLSVRRLNCWSNARCYNTVRTYKITLWVSLKIIDTLCRIWIRL